MSFDAENFVDEGNVEAGLPVNVEVDEAPPVEAQPAEEPKEKPVEAEAAPAPKKSFLVREDEDETQVPVHVVQGLRAKNRELKTRVEELEAQTRPTAENVDVGPDPLEGLADDEYPTAGQLRAAQERDRKLREAQARQAQQQAQQAAQQSDTRANLLASEQQTRKDHADYDAVMEAADAYLTPADFHAALQAKNPAKAMYARAKQTLSVLGIDIAPQAETKPKENKDAEPEAVQSDDELFAEIFGKVPT